MHFEFNAGQRDLTRPVPRTGDQLSTASGGDAEIATAAERAERPLRNHGGLSAAQLVGAG